MTKKFLIGSGLAAALVLGLLWRAKASPPAPMAKGSKILLLGDSLAVGLTARMKALSTASGYGFSSNAIVGSRTDQWSPKMDAILAAEAPNLLLVSLGTNDATTVRPEAQAIHFAAIAAAAERHGARLIWIEMPTLPARIAGQDVIRSIVNEVGPEVIETRSMVFDRASDEIHSSPQGYSSWADQIWADLAARSVVGA